MNENVNGGALKKQAEGIRWEVGKYGCASCVCCLSLLLCCVHTHAQITARGIIKLRKQRYYIARNPQEWVACALISVETTDCALIDQPENKGQLLLKAHLLVSCGNLFGLIFVLQKFSSVLRFPCSERFVYQSKMPKIEKCTSENKRG